MFYRSVHGSKANIRSHLVGALPWVFFLYAISLLISMAGMEIFSSLAALICLIVMAIDGFPTSPSKLRVVNWSLGFLLAVIIIGCFVNTPRPFHPVEIIGSARWILLFYLMSYGMAVCWSRSFEKSYPFFLTLTAIIGIYAVFQHYTGIDFVRHNHDAVQPFDQLADGTWLYRACGFIGGPMRYGHATAITICFPVASILLGMAKNWRAKLFYIFVITCLAFGLWSTNTRGAWLGAFCGLFTVAFFMGRKTVLQLALILAVSLGIGMSVNPKLGERMRSIYNLNSESNLSRVTIWRGNWAMFKDYPLLGIGYNENERMIPEYYKKLGITDGQTGHAHNNYFQYLSGTGLLGFLSYIIFLGAFYLLNLELWREVPQERVWERSLVLGGLGAQVANAVGGLTECNFKDAEVRHLFLFFMVTIAAIYWNKFPNAIPKKS